MNHLLRGIVQSPKDVYELGVRNDVALSPKFFQPPLSVLKFEDLPLQGGGGGRGGANLETFAED